MFYRIIEISTDQASGHTYLLVHFWPSRAAERRGASPSRKNDFLMQLRPMAERIVTDAQGRLKRADGTFIAPAAAQPTDVFERETVTVDVPARMRENIEAYWQRAEAGDYPKNHTTRTLRRDQSDLRGILVRPDVQALRGRGFQAAGR